MSEKEGSLFPSPEARDQLFARLALHGVKQVRVSFSGSGDSGQIDGVYFDGLDKAHTTALEADRIEWPEESSVHEGGQWVKKVTASPLSLGQIVELLCNDASHREGHDWCNNDGGSGEFIIDLTDLSNGNPRVKCDISENVVSTNDFSYDYSEGRDDEPKEDLPAMLRPQAD